jgi:putative ABC transport system substrate-binding protein
MDRRVFIAMVGGGIAAAPLGAVGQISRERIKQVGWLAAVALPRLQEEFRRGMQELGYVYGSDYRLLERYATGKVEQLEALASELVRLKVDVIVAEAIAAARAAQRATTTIPIVFITGDPVAYGLVQSLAHPEGNLTGVANLTLELYPKRIEVLKAAVPNLRRLAILAGPLLRPEVVTRVIQDAVKAQGIEGLPPTFISQAGEIEGAFTRAVKARADAILVTPNPFFNSQREHLVALAARHRLPALYEFRDFVEAGGLMCYGADNKAIYRRVATYVDRLLKGAKPADLPVEQPTKFELVINIKAAKALGLTIPQAILVRADEVIQ